MSPGEAAVQAALRGEEHTALFVTPREVAPVWLWLNACETGGGAEPAATPTPSNGTLERTARPHPLCDAHRRRARNVKHQPSRNAMLLAARDRLADELE